MRGVVTYDLGDGRRACFEREALRHYGLEVMLRSVGGEMPKARTDVYQRGRKVGSLPGNFDPDNIGSNHILYEPRAGDFARDGDKWIANKTLGPADLRAVPGFEKAELTPAPAQDAK